ncbi:MAG: RNA polymerase sigma factor [Planctomycetota bacterium]|jgi:RNA polymerase sigma-70 factor (ECF subfamily)
MTSASPEPEAQQQTEVMPGPTPVAREAEWIGEHQTGVWRFLRYLGCSAPLAEDLTQETFLAALEKNLVDMGPGAASAWLRKTARNLFYMQLRSDHRNPVRCDGMRMESHWSECVGEDQGDRYHAALELCLQGLDGEQRQALAMRYGEAASRSEMAKVLGIGEAGVKALLRRLRAKLKHCIQSRLRVEAAE